MKTYFSQLVKISVVLSCLICLSCSKDDNVNNTLDVDHSVLTFQPGIETKSFNITADGEWTITSAGLSQAFGANLASAGWFEISPVYGTGNAQINIITKTNSHNNSMILQIKYEKKEKTVTLNQN